MQKFFLFAFILFSNLLAGQNIADKLVAFFPFGFGNECKAEDATGNNSSGQPTTNPQTPGPSCVCGPANSAVRLDGIDDAILFVGSMNEVFTSGDFSVSFYMKPLPADGTQIVMSKQKDCDRNNAFWVRYFNKTRTISSGISENDSLLVTVSAQVDEQACWQFIVLTRNNKTYNLYLNGRLMDSKTSSERINLSSPELFSISEPVCGTDKHFRGDIDELRIYKKALSLDEINLLYLRPDYIANRDTLIYLGNSFQTNITGTCATSFEWQPVSGIAQPTSPTTTITPTAAVDSTVYYLYFKHGDCLAVDSVIVKVIDPATLDCNNIYVPNAFVPNGVNTEFFISNPFAVEDFISFEIFDRWGGRIKNFDDQFGKWDGTFDGKPVNPGIYLYRLRYRCKGDEKVKAGSITLIR